MLHSSIRENTKKKNYFKKKEIIAHSISGIKRMTQKRFLIVIRRNDVQRYASRARAHLTVVLTYIEPLSSQEMPSALSLDDDDDEVAASAFACVYQCRSYTYTDRYTHTHMRRIVRVCMSPVRPYTVRRVIGVGADALNKLSPPHRSSYPTIET